MADLIVIAYDSEQHAEEAYQTIQNLQQDLVVELAGLALVKVDQEGKTHVSTPNSGTMVGLGAASGALFGTLIGLLFFIPFVGLLVGGAFGALFAGLDRSGINQEFRQQVRDTVTAGRSAVVVYANKLTEDKFAAALAPYQGEVIKTSLSHEQEQELIHDLAGK